MSHIVTIQTEVRDLAAVREACRRLRLDEPTEGTVTLYSGEATGVIVSLPEWRYPVVCELNQGTLRFDNYEGRWGDRKHLNAFLQAYAVEKAKLESRKQGHSVVEQSLEDGSIKLTVQVGGLA